MMLHVSTVCFSSQGIQTYSEVVKSRNRSMQSRQCDFIFLNNPSEFTAVYYLLPNKVIALAFLSGFLSNNAQRSGEKTTAKL